MNKPIETAEVTPLSKPAGSTVTVPGSKSYSLRALVIAALCDEEFKISNLLDSKDVAAMQDCINALETKRVNIESEESGLTARFMTALAAISYGAQIISGAPSLQKRPIKDLVDALRQLGAQIEYTQKEGYLPLKIISAELAGGKVSLKGDVSSQYLSALLLIGPKLEQGLEIEVKGRQISKPYIDMTIDIMAYFGVKVENENYRRYKVKPQRYRAKDYVVEGDYSSAAYFFAINSLTGSHIKVEGLNPRSKQADRRFVEMIKDGVKPGVINMEDCPDQAMTMAVLAAFSDGKTTIKGIASLRIKETERIAAMQNELAKTGIETTSTKDSLTIYGGKPGPATIDTYNDHRIAMSFAVAGCKIAGLQITHPSVVDKTFPGFWDELANITEVSIGRAIPSKILLIGMRGSGKTTIGRILAEELGRKFIDMDLYLEQKQGKKVRDIVLSHGWENFRKLESEACKDLSEQTDSVISSGGGIVLDQKNMELFRNDSIIILLQADPKVLSKRIRNDKNRPELSSQPSLIGELDEVWEERKARYRKNAGLIIDTTYISPKQAVKDIIEKLEVDKRQTCLVIGDPVTHSLSPAIHNLGYQKLGIDNSFHYAVKHVTTDGLADFISQVRKDDIRGVSLTMPHKELVMPYLDEVDEVARQIGAVNTIVNENGRLAGYNTDWIGAIKPLEKATSLKGKKVALIGAGGTARAFCYALSKAGCDVTIYNRTVGKAKELAEKFNCNYASLEEQAPINKVDIICNTTSVGMNENIAPIDTSLINPNQIVFDVVYSPYTTKLLREASEIYATAISGVEMLLEQAFAQFKLFTGQDAPTKYLREEITKKVKDER